MKAILSLLALAPLHAATLSVRPTAVAPGAGASAGAAPLSGIAPALTGAGLPSEVSFGLASSGAELSAAEAIQGVSVPAALMAPSANPASDAAAAEATAPALSAREGAPRPAAAPSRASMGAAPRNARAAANAVSAVAAQPAFKAALAAPRGGAGAQQALSAAFDAAAADGSADAAPEPGAAPAPVANSRLSSLPPYIFVRLEALKAQAHDAGHDVIDLGKGSPDLPAPDVAVEAVAKAVRDPKTHTYPPAAGTPELRAAIAEWYRGRFGVDVDVARGVLPLIGSKEGIAHTLLAILEPGDGVLMPTPGYPAYANQITLAGGRPIAMELREEDGFLPDFDRLEAALSEARARGRVRAMILNYPSNPTGAVVPDLAFLQRALDFAKRHDLIVLYDNAYAEISFDGHDSPTMLQVPGAKEARVIEFHTLSKGWSMAGFRLGFAVGDPEVIGALAKLKGFFDYGLPAFNQAAAVAALKDSGDYVARTRAIYQARRDVLVAALGAIGWEVRPPKGAMYVWARLPDAARGMSALEFVERLIREEGVLISPGSAFGPAGEGYVRISLIQPQERLVEAAARIARFLARLTP